MKELMDYSWPGNVRELEHIIERSVLLADSDTIKDVHLPAIETKNQQSHQEIRRIITCKPLTRMNGIIF
jgi:formate hydrogenlyase transcriptional activator